MEAYTLLDPKSSLDTLPVGFLIWTRNGSSAVNAVESDSLTMDGCDFLNKHHV